MPGGIDDTVFTRMLQQAQQERMNRANWQNDANMMAAQGLAADTEVGRQQRELDLGLAERYGGVAEEMPDQAYLEEMAPDVSQRPRALPRATLGYLDQQQQEAAAKDKFNAMLQRVLVPEAGRATRAGMKDRAKGEERDLRWQMQGREHDYGFEKQKRDIAARWKMLKRAGVDKIKAAEARGNTDEAQALAGLQFLINKQGDLSESVLRTNPWGQDAKTELDRLSGMMELFAKAVGIDTSQIQPLPQSGGAPGIPSRPDAKTE